MVRAQVHTDHSTVVDSTRLAPRAGQSVWGHARAHHACPCDRVPRVFTLFINIILFSHLGCRASRGGVIIFHLFFCWFFLLIYGRLKRRVRNQNDTHNFHATSVRLIVVLSPRVARSRTYLGCARLYL